MSYKSAAKRQYRRELRRRDAQELLEQRKQDGTVLPNRVIPQGYVLVWQPAHPAASSSGYVLEHRLVMEQHLKRYLLPDEVVHHRNGDRADNRIENLQLFDSNSSHTKHHALQNGRVVKRIPQAWTVWLDDGETIKLARKLDL